MPTCYKPPCPPGNMCMQVCVSEMQSKLVQSPEEIQREYESSITGFMNTLRDAYVKYVQAVADHDLCLFKIDSLGKQLDAENAVINSGGMPSLNYLSNLNEFNQQKNQEPLLAKAITDAKAEIDGAASDIQSYLGSVKDTLDMYAIPTATFEQVYALVKKQTGLTDPDAPKPQASPLIPPTLTPTEPARIQLSDLTSQIDMDKVAATVQAAKPKTSPLLVASALAVGFLVFRRKK